VKETISKSRRLTLRQYGYGDHRGADLYRDRVRRENYVLDLRHLCILRKRC
jgi:hypothetical protein